MTFFFFTFDISLHVPTFEQTLTFRALQTKEEEIFLFARGSHRCSHCSSSFRRSSAGGGDSGATSCIWGLNWLLKSEKTLHFMIKRPERSLSWSAWMLLTCCCGRSVDLMRNRHSGSSCTRWTFSKFGLKLSAQENLQLICSTSYCTNSYKLYMRRWDVLSWTDLLAMLYIISSLKAK